MYLGFFPFFPKDLWTTFFITGWNEDRCKTKVLSKDSWWGAKERRRNKHWHKLEPEQVCVRTRGQTCGQTHQGTNHLCGPTRPSLTRTSSALLRSAPLSSPGGRRKQVSCRRVNVTECECRHVQVDRGFHRGRTFNLTNRVDPGDWRPKTKD